jgi:hypothetical protein
VHNSEVSPTTDRLSAASPGGGENTASRDASLARQISRDENRVLHREDPHRVPKSGVCTEEACAESHDQLDD